MDPYPFEGSYPLDVSVYTWWILVHLMDPYPLEGSYPLYGSVSPWLIRIHFKDRISLMDPYPFEGSYPLDGSVSTWWIRIPFMYPYPLESVSFCINSFFSDTQTADRLMERLADRQTGWLCKFQKKCTHIYLVRHIFFTFWYYGWCWYFKIGQKIYLKL